MEFTYDEYKRIICELREEGYDIINYYESGMPEEKKAILRHDVDLSLEKACEFARFEKDMGVSSIYYVLLSSRMYNIASVRSKELVKSIYHMGHQIGLHFDESIYKFKEDTWETQMKNCIKREREVMELIFDGEIPIQSVSMHIPSKRTLDADVKLDGMVNAYSKEFFCKWKYISDSNMHWREDVFGIIRGGGYNRLYILTHPVWYEKCVRSKKEKVDEFIQHKNDEIFKETSIVIPDINEL